MANALAWGQKHGLFLLSFQGSCLQTFVFIEYIPLYKDKEGKQLLDFCHFISLYII